MSGERGGPAKACSPWETISSSWCWAWPMSSAFQRRDWLVSTAFWYNSQPSDGKFATISLFSLLMAIPWYDELSIVMAQWWLYVELGQQCHKLSRDLWGTILGILSSWPDSMSDVLLNCIVQDTNMVTMLTILRVKFLPLMCRNAETKLEHCPDFQNS